MDKPLACIELSSSGVKLLVGYCLNGVPYCIYRSFKPLPGAFHDGCIYDVETYAEALKGFRNIRDDSALVSIDISEVCMVLPCTGLKIYENEKTTGTTATNNEIAKLDISNVVSLVRKQALPAGNAIVDIVPDEFILDNGERYINPPFGKRSESITMKAKIHALPQNIVDLYKGLVQHAEFRIRSESVSTYCLAEWIKTMQDMPSSYLLLDMGAKTTSISLIGNGAPYDSQSFFFGGDDLTELIAEGLGLSGEAAEVLKRNYGYDERKLSYDPTFDKFAGPGFETCTYRQEDLNRIISTYFEQFGGMMRNAVNALLGKYGNRHDSLPLVITGGASRLNGAMGFIKNMFAGREIYQAKSSTIGCLDDGYGALLGLLVASSQYKGTLGDNHHSMASVSRVPTKREKTRKPNYEEDNL